LNSAVFQISGVVTLLGAESDIFFKELSFNYICVNVNDAVD